MPIKRLTAELVREIIESYGYVRKLNLSSNEIARIEYLEALPLIKLNLCCNRLESCGGALEGLARLEALTDLDLSGNNIESLEPLSRAGPSLCRLNLADNNIADLAEARHLAALPALRELTLFGNPLCDRRGYRAGVLALLPQLQVLDDIAVVDAAEAIAGAGAIRAVHGERGDGGVGAAAFSDAFESDGGGGGGGLSPAWQEPFAARRRTSSQATVVWPPPPEAEVGISASLQERPATAPAVSEGGVAATGLMASMREPSAPPPWVSAPAAAALAPSLPQQVLAPPAGAGGTAAAAGFLADAEGDAAASTALPPGALHRMLPGPSGKAEVSAAAAENRDQQQGLAAPAVNGVGAEAPPFSLASGPSQPSSSVALPAASSAAAVAAASAASAPVIASSPPPPPPPPLPPLPPPSAAPAAASTAVHEDRAFLPPQPAPWQGVYGYDISSSGEDPWHSGELAPAGAAAPFVPPVSAAQLPAPQPMQLHSEGMRLASGIGGAGAAEASVASLPPPLSAAAAAAAAAAVPAGASTALPPPLPLPAQMLPPNAAAAAAPAAMAPRSVLDSSLALENQALRNELALIRAENAALQHLAEQCTQEMGRGHATAVAAAAAAAAGEATTPPAGPAISRRLRRRRPWEAPSIVPAATTSAESLEAAGRGREAAVAGGSSTYGAARAMGRGAAAGGGEEKGDATAAAAAATAAAAAAEEGEPYVRLLTRWRQQVLRLLMQREADRAAAAADAAAAARALARESELRRAAEARAGVAEGEIKVLRAGASRLSEQVRRAQEEAAAAAAEAAASAAAEALQRRAVAGLKSLVASFRGAASNGYHEKDAALQWALARLAEFQQRLALAAARVAAAAALQRRHDVQLRNSRAALEADRRVWLREREKREAAAVAAALAERGLPAGAGDGGDAGGRLRGSGLAAAPAAAAAAGAICRQRRPPERTAAVLSGLRPECEAVMRSVFCRLDVCGEGTVDGRKLAEVLRHDAGVAALMSRAVGRQRWLDALDAIDERLAPVVAAEPALPVNGSAAGGAGAVGSGGFADAGDGRNGDSCVDAAAASALRATSLTWGEFLLLFVPGASSSYRSGGSYSYSDSLHEAGGEGRLPEASGAKDSIALAEDDVALLQMVLPKGWDRRPPAGSGGGGGGGGGSVASGARGATASSLFPSLDALGVEQLQREVRRLARERSFLLLRWRDEDGAAVARSAEIHDLYRRELVLLREAGEAAWKRLAAVEAERDEAAAAAEGWQRRAAAAEAAAEERVGEAQRLVRAGEAAAAEAAAHAAAASREEEARLREKLSRLEAEHSLLRRAHGKALAAQHSMERELSRLSERLDNDVADERAAAAAKLRACEAGLAAARRERNALLAALREQQRGNVHMHGGGKSPLGEADGGAAAAADAAAAAAAAANKPMADCGVAAAAFLPAQQLLASPGAEREAAMLQPSGKEEAVGATAAPNSVAKEDSPPGAGGTAAAGAGSPVPGGAVGGSSSSSNSSSSSSSSTADTGDAHGKAAGVEPPSSVVRPGDSQQAETGGSGGGWRQPTGKLQHAGPLWQRRPLAALGAAQPQAAAAGRLAPRAAAMLAVAAANPALVRRLENLTASPSAALRRRAVGDDELC